MHFLSRGCNYFSGENEVAVWMHVLKSGDCELRILFAAHVRSFESDFFFTEEIPFQNRNQMGMIVIPIKMPEEKRGTFYHH